MKIFAYIKARDWEGNWLEKLSEVTDEDVEFLHEIKYKIEDSTIKPSLDWCVMENWMEEQGYTYDQFRKWYDLMPDCTGEENHLESLVSIEILDVENIVKI